MNKVTDSSAFDKSIQQVRALAESLGHQIQQWRDQPPEFYEMEKQVLAHEEPWGHTIVIALQLFLYGSLIFNRQKMFAG